MDGATSAAALAATAATALFVSRAGHLALVDPVPYYSNKSLPASEMLRAWARMWPPSPLLQSRTLVWAATGTAALAAWRLNEINPPAAAAFGAAAALNVAVMAFTLKRVLPINMELFKLLRAEQGGGEGAASEGGEEGTRLLLQQWGAEHRRRTAIGAASLAAMLWGLYSCLVA